MRQRTRLNPTVDGVELVLADQERVVLHVNLPALLSLREVQADVVIQSDCRKWPISAAAGSPKISVKKFADSRRSLAATMVWLNVMAM